jgi:benzoate membrane transport protein
MLAYGILAFISINTIKMPIPLLSRDAFSAWTAGFIAVLVGFTSSVALVFQAARAAGASPEQTGSWIAALCLGMGALSMGLSWFYKQPIKIAWSTPGAALLAVSLSGVSMPKVIGAFCVCGMLIFLSGVSKVFEKMIDKISVPIASGLLAGALARFALDAFLAGKSQPVLVASMFLAYLLARRFQPTYAALWVLLTGTLCAFLQQQINLDTVQFSWATPVWVTPEFDLEVAISVALPLFIVTMASQNVPGLAVLRAHGYQAPTSALIGWTGAVSTLLAPFGCYAINMAAITAALCMGKEIHPDPTKRYPAAMAAGFFYLLIAMVATSLANLLAALPKALILAVAGLALINTISNGLVAALKHDAQREPALITFLVTLSGVSFFGIGSAFWGIIAGSLSLVMLRK